MTTNGLQALQIHCHTLRSSWHHTRQWMAPQAPHGALGFAHGSSVSWTGGRLAVSSALTSGRHCPHTHTHCQSWLSARHCTAPQAAQGAVGAV
jgi:hypothetical protein